jgi:DNA mismatch endonuclease (patch repair protein)
MIRSAEAQRRIMQAIRSKDTKPELLVRRLVYRMGYRYRKHRKDLPGKPDLAFGPRRKVIFVHGCFWHAHNDPSCPDSRKPRINRSYWLPKLMRNKQRDKEHLEALAALGWETLVIWACEMHDQGSLQNRIRRFLGPKRRSLMRRVA